MKKSKKGLALILGAVMTISTIPMLETAAYWDENFAGTMCEPPEGYEAIDPEFFEKYEDQFLEKGKSFIVHSWNTKGYLQGYSHYGTNTVTLYSDTEDAEEIHAILDKYNAELGMDYEDRYVSEYDGMYTLFRTGNSMTSTGHTMEDLEAEYQIAEEKRSTIIKMCREMYKTGHVKSIIYTPISASPTIIDVSDFTVVSYTGTYEELETAVLSQCPSAEITANSSSSYTITMSNEATGTEYINAAAAVDALDGEHTLSLNMFRNTNDLGVGSVPMVNGQVDLVDMFKEEASCDTDNSGEIEITDATAILESYANTAAGVAAASEENPMDVNGDGTVGIDDATFVLTVYAELAAGLR